jgi:hypothetical protein
VVQSLLAVTHGALGPFFFPSNLYTTWLNGDLAGITPWNDPTSSDIKAAATTLGQQLIPSLTRFALDPHVTFTTYVWQRVHFGMWRVDDQMLVVGVNLNPHVWRIPLAQLPGWNAYMKLEVVYNGGASFESADIVLWDLSSVGFVVTM